MSLTMSRPHERTLDTGLAYAALWVLRLGFGILPIVVGVDKFSDHLTDWTQYLWPGIPHHLHLAASTVMHLVGVTEIVAGLLVLFAPEIGGAIVAVWLAVVASNIVLVAHAEHEYWDIAVRDFGLMLGAVSLTLLAHAVASHGRAVPAATRGGVATGDRVRRTA